MSSRNLVGGHLIEGSVRVSMLLQPDRSRLAIIREMDEFRIRTASIEDADRTECWALQNLEGQIGIETEGSVNAYDDGTLAAEIRLMQGEIPRRGVVAGLARPSLRIRRPLLFRVCQAASFFLKRSGGRGLPSDQATTEPIGARS